MRSSIKTLAFLLVAATAGCKGKQELINKLGHGSAGSDVAEAEPAETGSDSAADDAKRVAAVFPNGPATEHAAPKVTFDPFSHPSLIDPTTGWVLEVPLHTPLTLAQISDAMGETPATSGFVALGARKGSEPWVDVELDDTVSDEATFDRVAIELPFVGVDQSLSAADIALASTWMNGKLANLHGGTPVPSSRPEAALARGERVAAVIKSVEDSSDFVVTISRPNDKPIPLRLAWDAMYSAGYVWSGDLMEWTPSADVHGLFSFTATESGLWSPEDAANPDATTADIHIHFNVPANPQTERMLDVLLQQSRYIAKRVGGRVIDNETDKPLDERQFRQRIAAQVKILTNAGITPGSPLAVSYFY